MTKPWPCLLVTGNWDLPPPCTQVTQCSKQSSPTGASDTAPHLWPPNTDPPFAPACSGIESAKVAQAQFGELRGAKALADIPPNEPFITVPRSAALVVTPQQRCPGDSIDAAYWKSAPWWVAVAVAARLVFVRHSLVAMLFCSIPSWLGRAQCIPVWQRVTVVLPPPKRHPSVVKGGNGSPKMGRFFSLERHSIGALNQKPSTALALPQPSHVKHASPSTLPAHS